MNSEHTWEQLPFDRLVQRYLDGQVTPDEMETLNLHLSSNAAARQSLDGPVPAVVARRNNKRQCPSLERRTPLTAHTFSLRRLPFHRDAHL